MNTATANKPTPVIYTPKADTLPARVCYFFKCNPEEELSLDDITGKFDATRGNIHTQMAYALEAKLVHRAKNGDGEWIYTAGSQLSKYGGAFASEANPPNTAAPAVAQRPSRKGRKINSPAPKVDVDAIVIEDGIPLPDRQTRKGIDWASLLRRLKPGQSCLVPLANRYGLNKAICAVHKQGDLGTFCTRSDPASESLRVWRTA